LNVVERWAGGEEEEEEVGEDVVEV